jgi:hypothetical protein
MRGAGGRGGGPCTAELTASCGQCHAHPPSVSPSATPPTPGLFHSPSLPTSPHLGEALLAVAAELPRVSRLAARPARVGRRRRGVAGPDRAGNAAGSGLAGVDGRCRGGGIGRSTGWGGASGGCGAGSLRSEGTAAAPARCPLSPAFPPAAKKGPLTACRDVALGGERKVSEARGAAWLAAVGGVLRGVAKAGDADAP